MNTEIYPSTDDSASPSKTPSEATTPDKRNQLSQPPEEPWAKDLWFHEIEPRLRLINCTVQELRDESLNSETKFSLAVTEVFVQRAQTVLAQRAKKNYTFAALSMMSLILILYHLVSELNPTSFKWKKDELDTFGLFIYILRSLTVTACYFVTATILFSLSKIFITSANRLLDQRHALRFGKLIVYHNRANKISVSELEQAFQWNREMNLDPFDLKSDSIKSPVGQFTAVIEKLIDKLPSGRRSSVKDA